MRFPSRALAAFASFAPLVVACSGAPGGGETVGTSSQAITGSDILARGDQWVQAQLLYCQSANHAPDYDTSCASTCTRQDNPAWDAYRSDCSGFVSWAWGLPAPGRDTAEFAPADTTVSYVINGADLQPGDALNVPSDHIVLFVGWKTVGSVANFYEEPGCSAAQPYAHAFTSNVTINGSSVDIAYEGKTFTAIRFTGLAAGDGGATTGSGAGGGTDVVPDAGGSPCSLPSGEQGECLDTSVCAALGGSYMPTPGYCPGASNIQCCTGMPPGSTTGSAADAGVAGQGAPDSSTSGSTSTPPSGSGTGGTTGAPGSGSTGTGSTGAGSGTGGTSTGGASSGAGASSSADGGAGTVPHGSDGFAASAGPASCSVAPSRSRVADGAWMLGLGALGLAWSSRRRRRSLHA